MEHECYLETGAVLIVLYVARANPNLHTSSPTSHFLNSEERSVLTIVS